MVKKIESSQPALFTRPALLEGCRNGELPVPEGKWVWPGAALALALGTAWGAKHIEDQVHQATPQILAEAGIASSGLSLNTNYRTVNLSGIVSENHSRSHVETILTKYDGPTGVNIRKANVSALEKPVLTLKPATKTKAVAPLPPPEVRVSAVVDHEVLTLSGMVPSQDDVDVLVDAAQQSSIGINVVNRLKVSDTPLNNKDIAESINNLAMIMANFDTDVIDAHIDIDDDLLTGNITTATNDATDKLKAYLPSPMIGVITDVSSPKVNVIPEPEAHNLISSEVEIIPLRQEPQQPVPLQPVPLQQIDEQTTTPVLYEPPPQTSFQESQITLLQSEIDQLESAIRDQVVFAPGSNVLTSSARSVLDVIIEALHTYPDTSIDVSGHTDSQSSAESNLALSHQRAEAVAGYIASHGIAGHRLIAIGFGESHPIASNDTTAGRALNRRVEFRAH